MSNEEMINAFLAKQKVTVCPEADMLETDGTSRRRNQIGSVYNIPKLNARQATRFTCEQCGKTDSVVPDLKGDTGKTNKPGYVNGVYKGNTLCKSCRKKAINEHRNTHNKVIETERIKRALKTDANYKCYMIVRDITIPMLEKFNKTQLDTYIADATKLINLYPNKVIQVRLAKAALITPRSTDNWDDWDTPLGE